MGKSRKNSGDDGENDMDAPGLYGYKRGGMPKMVHKKKFSTSSMDEMESPAEEAMESPADEPAGGYRRGGMIMKKHGHAPMKTGGHGHSAMKAHKMHGHKEMD